MTLPAERLVTDDNVIFRDGGRLQACRCGANVFHRIAENRYGCNGCEAVYETAGRPSAIPRPSEWTRPAFFLRTMP